jgi:hypothetical protein
MMADPTPAAHGRIRRLRSLVDSPADAWLLCRMASWAAVLPLLKRVVRLETLVRLMWTEPDVERNSLPEITKIVVLSRLLTRATARFRAGCYERSLLAYRFLAQCGADPRLVVAVNSSGGAVTAHAWVTVAGSPVDESEAIEDFVPVVVYGRCGLPEE